VKAEADKCFELYQISAISVAQFKERFQPLDARKHEIDRETPRIEAEIAALNIEEISCEHIAAEGRNFYGDWPMLPEERKRAVVELFLKNIVVGVEDMSINLFTLPVFEMMADGQRMDRGLLPR
jgi:hypothetical protein